MTPASSAAVFSRATGVAFGPDGSVYATDLGVSGDGLAYFVPTPGSPTLLAAAGLAASRRRR